MVRLDYDDDVCRMIDKINAALKNKNLQLVDDNQIHDGFVMLALMERA